MLRPFGFALALGLGVVGEFQVDAQSLVCAGTNHYREEASAPVAKFSQGNISSLDCVNALVVFARFNDGTSDPSQPPQYANAIFDPNLPGSFTHFYHTMSKGQLLVQGTVLPKRYISDQAADAYLAAELTEYGNYGQFVLEILRQVDRDVDLGLVDNDGPDGVPNSGDDDGIVDYVFVNVLSTPKNFILGPATGINGLGMAEYISADRAAKGENISIIGSPKRGALQREGVNLAQAVGAMAHEFGHSLGLPDLYDTSFLVNPNQPPAEDSAGIGCWGLMGWGALGWNGDDGPNSFCAWSLEQLGWIGPNNERLVEITQDTQGLYSADLFKEGFIYKIPLSPIPLATYESGRQGYIIQKPYLLLEYRSPDAHYYRRNLPGEGLLVWRIQPHSFKNVDEENKLVDLVCADGLYAEAGYPQGRIQAGVGGRDNLDFWAHAGDYATAHQGNMGDATDMFDGVRFRQLTPSSNPALSPVSTGCTGIRIEDLRRQGQGMVADIILPQWAGTINELVHWQGEVRVSGDVVVAPAGTLAILEDTRVYIDAQDRLSGGRDPARCEIHLKGQVKVIHAFPYASNAIYIRDDYEGPVGPVVFQAARPGAQWYGLVVDPDPSVDLKLTESSFELQDAVYGLVMAEAPPGAAGLTLNGYSFIDARGNGWGGASDEPSSAGERFQIAVELADWSLTAYEEVQAKLQWDTPLVSSVQAVPNRSINSEPFSLYPGQEIALLLPALALSEAANVDQRLDFVMQLWQGPTLFWQDSLMVVVPAEDVPTAVFEGVPPLLDTLAFLPSFPNPFNLHTTLNYTVPGVERISVGEVHLDIFNISGQHMRTLVNEVQGAGVYQVQWDGLDRRGRPVASGVYIGRLRLGNRALEQRLVLVK